MEQRLKTLSFSCKKMGLNPVSATIHHAEMSLSKILKPCQLRGCWSVANPDVPAVCVKRGVRFHPGIILLLLICSYVLSMPFQYCMYCLRAYCCGNQTARRYCRRDILCVHETGCFKPDPILSLLVNIMSAAAAALEELTFETLSELSTLSGGPSITQPSICNHDSRIPFNGAL